MDFSALAGAILASLNAVQAFLPMLGAAGQTASVVTTVITALTKIVPVLQHLAPVAGDEVSLIYQGVKNIIATVRNVGTTAEQDAALDALDERVDDAWDAVAAKFDPDYIPPAVG